MNQSREALLQRVRQAVQAGNQAGNAKPVQPRGSIGYQGAGPDAVARFEDAFTAAGGQFHPVGDREAAGHKVLEILRSRSARRPILGRGPFLDACNLPGRLRAAGLEVLTTDQLTEDACRDPLFGADVGITGVDYLIAETGSVVLLAKPGEPRSVSLLPPIHLAIADRSQVLPDLFDLFEREDRLSRSAMPSCVSVITGPSKTGDIELRLVTGVHGPGEIHVILLEC